MRKQNLLLIISSKKAVFANQKDIPANRGKNGAKNLANQKGARYVSYAIIPDTIQYFFVYIECLFLLIRE